MGINKVWGFDPDEAEKAPALFRSSSTTGAGHSWYGIADERAARMPPDSESQIYELWRIFRLW